jgi:hypothetical protein
MKITGTIESVKAIEEAIKATKKAKLFYNGGKQGKGVLGKEFNSQYYSMIYELYPDINFTFDSNYTIDDALRWLVTEGIAIRFLYDYRNNEARIKFNTLKYDKLKLHIPNFDILLGKVRWSNNGFNKEAII